MRSLIALSVTLAAGGTAVRSVYLNGTDISSARSQEMRGVDIVINEKGDILIQAPQYQVNEEDTYVPLTKFVQGMNAPKHQPMQAVQPVAAEPVKAMPHEDVAPDTAIPGGAIPKAGVPVSQTAHPATLVPAGTPTHVAPGEAPEPAKGEAVLMDDSADHKDK